MVHDTSWLGQNVRCSSTAALLQAIEDHLTPRPRNAVSCVIACQVSCVIAYRKPDALSLIQLHVCYHAGLIWSC